MQMQQRPPLQTRIDALAHPAFGGRSHGYPEAFRDLVMGIRQQGETHNPLIANLRLQHLYPSLVTDGRWQSLFDNPAHLFFVVLIFQKSMNGSTNESIA